MLMKDFLHAWYCMQIATFAVFGVLFCGVILDAGLFPKLRPFVDSRLAMNCRKNIDAICARL